ncbi:cilia- and flagella-associated protein 45-like [Syngnathus scovelli]|uniref:cilia- and flagella-associated protein 45-like n=1 Tax=Syngnathus scovelli TaxID=161590 RepID=UPI002110A023|nr:cilia- and flagella-associated protein 45-like [Syngnathus scovelli]
MSNKKKTSKSDKKPSIPPRQNEPQKQILICHRGDLRTLRVPREEVPGKQLSLSSSEYDRILARTKEKTLQAEEKASQKKLDDIKAAEERKRQMIEKDRRSALEAETDLQSKKQSFERYQHMRCKAQMEEDSQIQKLDTRIQRCKIQSDLDTQFEWKKHCEAVEIAKEKAEFERMVKYHQRTLNKVEEKEKRRKEKRLLHLEVLKEQIREKEDAAAAIRRERINMAKHETDDVKLKNKCIDELKEERLSDLKASGIPEKYYKYVEKKSAEAGAKSKQFQYHAQ